MEGALDVALEGVAEGADEVALCCRILLDVLEGGAPRVFLAFLAFGVFVGATKVSHQSRIVIIGGLTSLSALLHFLWCWPTGVICISSRSLQFRGARITLDGRCVIRIRFGGIRLSSRLLPILRLRRFLLEVWDVIYIRLNVVARVRVALVLVKTITGFNSKEKVPSTTTAGCIVPRSTGSIPVTREGREAFIRRPRDTMPLLVLVVVGI